MADIGPRTGHAYLFPNYCTEQAKKAEQAGDTATAQAWRDARWHGHDVRNAQDLEDRRAADGSAKRGKRGH